MFAKYYDIPLKDIKLIAEIKPKQERLKKFSSMIKPFIIVQHQANAIARSLSPNFTKKLLDELCEQQGMPIVIMSRPSSHQEVEDLRLSLKHPERIVNMCKYSNDISDLIAVISMARFVISVDSSPLHIASALNVPAFGIFGAFTGKIRCETYDKVWWIDSTAPCSPCFRHGHTPCDNSDEQGFSKCFNYIDIKKLVTSIMDKMNDYTN
jgi:ADP-heptose:LPS heptosyltransferase